jgi:hypothetical protein
MSAATTALGHKQSLAGAIVCWALSNYLIRKRFWVGLRSPATKHFNGLPSGGPFSFAVRVTPG